MASWRDLIPSSSPTVLLGNYGRRLVAGTMGYLLDSCAEILRHAVRAPWIGVTTESGPPGDALGPAGEELLLERYPPETDEQYHARLQRAWDDWPFAGHENTIIAQLAAAGWPGAIIYTAADWPDRAPTPYWSQFWVLFPPGTHSVVASSAAYDDGTLYDDGAVYDAQGITAGEVALLLGIIRKWKPGHWVCRGVIFVISGFVYDDGTTYDSGAAYDGSQVEMPI